MSRAPSRGAPRAGRPPWLPRRGFLRTLGGAGLSATALGAMLGGCAAADLAPVPLPRGGRDLSRSEPVVRFATWLNYIDNAPGRPALHPTLAEFTRRTGVAVEFSEPITGNEQFFSRIGIPLAMGWATGYDLVVLTDWVLSQLIQLGWASELSPGAVPNGSRLLPKYRDWPVPDVRRYSLPWQCGFTGIVYNTAVTRRPVTGMRDLLTAPDLRGKVSLSTDMRDVMGLVMLDMGIDPSTFTEREFGAALAVLGRAAQSGQIATVTNYYGPGLMRGTFGASVGWAGDALELRDHHPDISFTWPKAGGLIWSDNLMVPVGASHTENAERLMNYYYEPETAAQLTLQERYTCPVQGTETVMALIDADLPGKRFIFPSAGLLDTGRFFRVLTPKQNAAYVSQYQSTVGL
jgi:spermidine/putrescine transport system substrate-binding protein